MQVELAFSLWLHVSFHDWVLSFMLEDPVVTSLKDWCVSCIKLHAYVEFGLVKELTIDTNFWWQRYATGWWCWDTSIRAICWLLLQLALSWWRKGVLVFPKGIHESWMLNLWILLSHESDCWKQVNAKKSTNCSKNASNFTNLRIGYREKQWQY